ncbi:MAG: hypothetical protein R3C56_28515 [Pirellulaceae bacterium]
MARPNRSESLFTRRILHCACHQPRRQTLFLLGDDPLTGKNYDHRKEWIEILLQHQAKHFGIDLLCFSLMSSHFHLVLKSQPEIVGTWTSREVARRWLKRSKKRLHFCPAANRVAAIARQTFRLFLSTDNH